MHTQTLKTKSWSDINSRMLTASQPKKITSGWFSTKQSDCFPSQNHWKQQHNWYSIPLKSPAASSKYLLKAQTSCCRGEFFSSQRKWSKQQAASAKLTSTHCGRGDQTHIVGVFVEANLHKLLEGLGEAARQLGWVVLGNEEQHAHGVKVRVGRLALRKLYCCDAQTPDVRLDNTDQLWQLDRCVICKQSQAQSSTITHSTAMMPNLKPLCSAEPEEIMHKHLWIW